MPFSIVTATWQAENGIARCVRSVRGQNRPDVEHLILDNCSTDSTVELAVRENPAVKPFVEPDHGIYDAMNKGISRAQNDIIACLNADDAYLPGALDAVAKAFESAPEAGIVYGNITVNGHVCRPPQGLASFQGARIFHPAAFIRKRLFAELGPFNPAFRICADLDFFLKARKAGVKFIYLDFPMTDFALGGLSTQQYAKTCSEVRRILRLHGYSAFFCFLYFLCTKMRGVLRSIYKGLRK